MKYFLISLLFVASNSYGEDLLKSYCDKAQGEVVKGFKCPKNRLKLPWNFCISQDRLGRTLFFDGCTGPAGDYKALFFPACIAHDNCYHHEPNSNGISKAQCDQKFLTDMTESCKEAEDSEKCVSWAKTMYRAVDTFGELAFNCAKYEAEY